jgi:zinc transport system permease protein
MAILAGVIGAIAVCGGLGSSWVLDTPAGPSIVVMALVLFGASSASSAVRAPR